VAVDLGDHQLLGMAVMAATRLPMETMPRDTALVAVEQAEVAQQGGAVQMAILEFFTGALTNAWRS
jgi:hypothetical protein